MQVRSGDSASYQQSRRRELIDSSRFSSLNSIPETMERNPDVIHKALRLVPDFDGNANVLTRFIRICDQLCNEFLSDDPTNQLINLYLLNGILNKITGPAATIINSNGIPDSWIGIRNTLVNNFADQRDETALYNDLSLARQGNSSPQEFYDQCQTLFSTIMTYVTLHETIGTTIEAKRTLYKKLTMQAFVRGLKEPLGSRIRCMRPETIEKALEYVQEELNILYQQQRTDNQPRPQVGFRPPPAMPTGFSVPKPVNFNAPIHSLANQPMQRFTPQPPAQRYVQPQSQPFKFNNNFQQRMPSRTQQMFGAPPPRYNPQSNNFRLPPRNQPQLSNPRPMSGVQHFIPKALPPTLSGHDWRRFGNPPPNNYFKSREINLNECAYYDDSYYQDYYDTDYYNDVSDYNYYDTTYDYDDRVQFYEPTTSAESNDEPQASCSNSNTESDFQKPGPSNKLR